MVWIFITSIFVEKMCAPYCSPSLSCDNSRKQMPLLCIVFKDGCHQAVPSLYVHDTPHGEKASVRPPFTIWADWWLCWTIAYGKRDAVPALGLVYMRSGTFCFLLLGVLSCHIGRPGYTAVERGHSGSIETQACAWGSSGMPSPREPSDNFSSNYHFMATMWDAPNEKHPTKPS